MIAFLASLQAVLALLLASRLIGGRSRRPAEAPKVDGLDTPRLTLVVACLNEAARIGPCLEGLMAQGRPVTRRNGHSE